MFRRIFIVALTVAMAAGTAACGSNNSSGCPTCPIVEPPPPPPLPGPPEPTTATLAYRRIMPFGDSLTEGQSLGALRLFPTHDPGTPGVTTSYPSRLLALLSSHYRSQTFSVFNGGLGGESALQALPRFEEHLGEYNPQVVILLHGVNDLNGGQSIEAIIDAIEGLIEEAREHSVEILLSTLPRQRPDGRRGNSAPRIVPFNSQLRTLADALDVPLVDIYPHLTTTMLTPDGLHITAAGNQRLAEVYFEALRDLYEENAPAGLR